MYTPTQLEAIRIFGRKDLTKGCIVKIKGDNWIRVNDFAEILADHKKSGAVLVLYALTGKGVGEIKAPAWLYPEEEEYKTLEILGHEPHLEDVFRVAKEEGMSYFEFNDNTMEFWNELGIQKDSMSIPYNPTLQLLEQSESTLQQLISLFK